MSLAESEPTAIIIRSKQLRAGEEKKSLAGELQSVGEAAAAGGEAPRGIWRAN